MKKSNALLKSFFASLALIAVLVFILGRSWWASFGQPKFWLGLILIIAVFAFTFYASLERYTWEDKLNSYVTRFALTSEKLAQITGRSKYDFSETKSGKIIIATKNKKERKQMLHALEKIYGPLV